MTHCRHWVGLFWVLCSGLALADGVSIGKVYHPYVTPLEWDLEWRALHVQENPEDGRERLQEHALGLGRALSDRLFLEGYLIGERSAGESLRLAASELELLWQLSEQGEYALDYGLLFELEHEREFDDWEAAAKLLLEREFGRFSATANLGLIREWGNGVDSEWETSLALQGRYRHARWLEPAIELHLGEDTRAAGPVLLGSARLGTRESLHWEMGVILGLDAPTPDYTLRGLLEYEF
ncbi:hypothetical protein [Haliea atlantica]|nr:hypothetical protein [Haliea sp.]MAL95781.1 hypothetical protein [Haliea sp.]